MIKKPNDPNFWKEFRKILLIIFIGGILIKTIKKYDTINVEFALKILSLKILATKK
jgi:hypothetical protein